MHRLIVLAILVAPACQTELEEGAVDARAGCTSLCATGERRCAEDGKLQVCADYDSDGCNQWGQGDVCPAGLFCTDGQCAASCVNECSADEGTCEGALVRRCVEGPGGCLRLAEPEFCADEQRCDDGRCVSAGAPCEDTCTELGQRECFKDGHRQCGYHDTDDCLEFSATVPCGPTERCVGDGACVSNCDDECTEDAVSCEGGNVVTCGNFDTDACLELSAPSPCDAGQRCEQGRCVANDAQCEDECDIQGAANCDSGNGATGLRVCDQFDQDPCLDLGPLMPCEPTEFCELGSCVEPCADECVSRARQCTETGVEVCGNFDGDPCVEWGAAVMCRPDQRCDGGACVDMEVECEDECPGGERRCTPDGPQLCADHDDDPCVEWSSPAPCNDEQDCLDGVCVDREPPADRILINEIHHDPPEADAPNVFIELFGPPGAPLEGYRLVGVNGANGQDYAAIPLEGNLPRDGFFVIAHPDANPALRAIASQLHPSADLQNGPDSIQLRFQDQRIDSLAYGDFDPDEFPAGEGDPAREGLDAESLSRNGRQVDSDNNARDFSPADPSPGGP